MPHLFVFGYGYSAGRVGARLLERGWRVSGTRRSEGGVAELEAAGVTGHLFDGEEPSSGVRASLGSVTHLLVSIPPGAGGDPVLRHHRADIAGSGALAWIGYLSTTGVYGDRGGAWVDETTPPKPGTARSRRRLSAEGVWTETASESVVTAQLFRLAGIYGPGRSVLDRLRAGKARRIVAPGLVFNRIHVVDVEGAVLAGIACPERTGIFNVSDDLPAPPGDVVAYGAKLLGMDPPPEAPVEEAELSEKARAFFTENKRVRAARLRDELGYRLRYPTYRDGLTALADRDLHNAID